MTTKTACAFDKMASAADEDGVRIMIASGFRTVPRQEYFWNCYQTKKCNSGNKAARPGTSNHGRGVALDLNTNCGKQKDTKPNCSNSKVYQWLKNNAHKYGFKRTVQSEPWHWEYVGSGASPASFT
jgi:LAS superfamily LD-carboxypeptidase LdcB